MRVRNATLLSLIRPYLRSPKPRKAARDPESIFAPAPSKEGAAASGEKGGFYKRAALLKAPARGERARRSAAGKAPGARANGGAGVPNFCLGARGQPQRAPGAPSPRWRRLGGLPWALGNVWRVCGSRAATSWQRAPGIKRFAFPPRGWSGRPAGPREGSGGPPTERFLRPFGRPAPGQAAERKCARFSERGRRLGRPRAICSAAPGCYRKAWGLS
ncbi:hypothetical protein LSM04_008440 [Trypanosoma melophagium]|uniref:uncharacterized protein n=1 Tax=Trypanosoma melophagium TaxID=715481 RepID=UPI00351A8990|nr:hypothetical protein LSM04_008440 [Trypanosoma melophagium]